ncbi:unnamed protein product [Triticum turgidum subsp. durum]|uniref:Uncharacterized protein n=1 Tax=Triticum turgidum subsp. durum TaxID=4567 RepID=A0A9R0WLF6_TRITD|nr:unnamed protein product [Triticum turgidum subsp. durum]
MCLDGCIGYRFADPLIDGQYAQIMQDLVKERLPRFTPDQAKVVKGSPDYTGVNQYRTNFTKEPKLMQQALTSYSVDLRVMNGTTREPQLNRGGEAIGMTCDQMALQLGQADLVAVYWASEGSCRRPPLLVAEVKHHYVACVHLLELGTGIKGQKVGDPIDYSDAVAVGHHL